MPEFIDNCDLLGSIDELIEAGGRTKGTLQRESNVLSSFNSFLDNKFHKVREKRFFFYFYIHIARILVRMENISNLLGFPYIIVCLQ